MEKNTEILASACSVFFLPEGWSCNCSWRRAASVSACCSKLLGLYNLMRSCVEIYWQWNIHICEKTFTKIQKKIKYSDRLFFSSITLPVTVKHLIKDCVSNDYTITCLFLTAKSTTSGTKTWSEGRELFCIRVESYTMQEKAWPWK